MSQRRRAESAESAGSVGSLEAESTAGAEWQRVINEELCWIEVDGGWKMRYQRLEHRHYTSAAWSWMGGVYSTEEACRAAFEELKPKLNRPQQAAEVSPGSRW